ncbi:MAG: DNA polymerase IV [Candidatus Ornithospirochaeta sp.]
MGTVFFHIDLDAFFASVECLDHPEYRGKPLIIGHPGPRSVASTCSYEARKYGVHSAMPMTTALRLCPDAICVSGNYRRYSEKSKEVMDIIRSFAPGFLQISIDEAFLDLTGMTRIYPLPGKAARKLKEEILKNTGLTVSIGVAPSRFLAKLASDFHKPDGLTIVPRGKEEEFIDAVGLEKLWGVGKSTLEAIRRKGISSTRTLRNYSKEELSSLFGENTGEYLYSVSRGIDPGIYQGEAKSHSISEEHTYWPDLYGKDALESELLLMSQSVMFRALDEKSVGRTVTVKLRYGDFSTSTISETPKSGIYSSDDIYKIACRLLEKKYNNCGVRLLGVSLGNVYEGENPEQGEFFVDKKQKLRTLEKTILSLSKEGNKITRATSLKDE